MVTLETRIKEITGSNLCFDTQYLTEAPAELPMYLQRNAAIISQCKIDSLQTLPNSCTTLKFDAT
jgi:hypothetical protein